MYIAGLDPSLKKAGFVILNTEKPISETVDKGLLKTSTDDGILIERLIKQYNQIKNLLEKYNVTYVGMEAPYFEGGSAEILFALNQFIHRIFVELGTYVVCFPPQMLKKLVFPDTSVNEIHKPQMIDKAKTALGLQGKKLAEDVADAYWAGVNGMNFYKWHIEKSLKDEDLSPYALDAFGGKHTFTRGDKKGVTDYYGIIYRENELFYDFKKISLKRKS